MPKKKTPNAETVAAFEEPDIRAPDALTKKQWLAKIKARKKALEKAGFPKEQWNTMTRDEKNADRQNKKPKRTNLEESSRHLEDHLTHEYIRTGLIGGLIPTLRKNAHVLTELADYLAWCVQNDEFNHEEYGRLKDEVSFYEIVSNQATHSLNELVDRGLE